MSQQINLFNPIFLQQKKIFTAAHIAQMVGVVALGAALIALYGQYRVSVMAEQLTAAKTRTAARAALLDKVNAEFAPREKSKVLEAEVQRLQAELATLREVEGVLKGGELGNTAGYSEYLRAFARQNVPGLWLTGLGITGAGKQISVQGKALQAALIPGYIERLTQEPVMRGKTFGSLQIGRPEVPVSPAAVPGVIEFRLQSQPAEASK